MDLPYGLWYRIGIRKLSEGITVHDFTMTISPIFQNTSALVRLSERPLQPYTVDFSLTNLVFGVDNIRYDVYLSPDFCKTTGKIVLEILAKHSAVGETLEIPMSANWSREINGFKQSFRDLMVGAIHEAKSRQNLQLDFLAQAAVIRMCIEAIREQFENLTMRFRNLIRKFELSSSGDMQQAIWLKEQLARVQQDRELILLATGRELFDLLIEVHRSDLRPLREANFGPEAQLPDEIYTNPILHLHGVVDDHFLIRTYDILLGHRPEDPDKYETILRRLTAFLERIKPGAPAGMDMDAAGTIDQCLRRIENIEVLFNCFQTRSVYRSLKKKKAPKSDLKTLRQLIRFQKKRLNACYNALKKTGLTRKIAAFYESQTIYDEYCPPLVPQQILQYLIAPKSRKAVAARLKKLAKIYHHPYTLESLKRGVTNLKRMSSRKKKAALVRFLSGFVRYHRDLENFNRLKQAMDCINLAKDEKILTLSSANNTLHVFLQPHEQTAFKGEQPIINHVVIKADVRGSTVITEHMKQQGLNPASYFSLNFFNPISELLGEYGAVKEFIEGDAIILSIFEKEDTPQEWYSVARACGLAINMLLIIRRYNAQIQKHQLPILELGVGISFSSTPPTFLFDGKNRIMISSAINLADRLSSCYKPARRHVEHRKAPFNLYVYQPAADTDVDATPDDIFLRYNVNGIELSVDGMKKLAREIDLQTIDCRLPDIQKDPIRVHTGTFPTVTGRYQRLIIREAYIPEIDPLDFRTKRITPRKYFEVCTHPGIYRYVRNICSAAC